MAFIGNKIVQSRTFIDPNAKPAPNLNFKNTFPITVFDAVRESMNDENSKTLTTELSEIHDALAGKQRILPAKSADNLVTYGGIAGAVGSVKISDKIPVAEEDQSDIRIPTEKAVGELLRKYRLITESGEPIQDTSARVVYKYIVGTPEIHDDLGDDEEGYISQAAMTTIINNINTTVNNVIENLDATGIGIAIQNHISDINNPHHITPVSIGAVSESDFQVHLNDTSNPHHVTKEQVGLDKVDNTSDIDKPISRSVQVAINQINEMIAEITGMVGGIRYITDIDYDQQAGRLNLTFNNNTQEGVNLITDGLIDEVYADNNTHELVIQELNGRITKINLLQVIGDFLGYNGEKIKITVTENNALVAEIQPKSLTSNDMKDDGVIGAVLVNGTVDGSKLKDDTITSDKYGDESITDNKIASGTITGGKVDTHTLTGTNLFSTDVANSVLAVVTENGDAEWTKVNSDMIGVRAIEAKNIALNTIVSNNIAEQGIDTTNYKNGSITGNKLEEGTITGREISSSVELTGTPTLATMPDLLARNGEIVSAEWVRKAMSNIITDDMIEPHTITGKQIFTTNVTNRILMVVDSDGDAEWGKVQPGMIDDGAVEENNIAPGAVNTASIADKAVIAEKIADGAIISSSIQEGAIGSTELFASNAGNRVLAVREAGEHPDYYQVETGMIASEAVSTRQLADAAVTVEKIATPDEPYTILQWVGNETPVWKKIVTDNLLNRVVTGQKLFSSTEPNMILAVLEPNTDPVWTKLTSAMISDINLNETNLLPNCINHDHLKEYIVDTINIRSNAIVTSLIANEAVTAEKIFRPADDSVVLGLRSGHTMIEWTKIQSTMIEDHSITGEKIFPASEAFTVLGVENPGETPAYKRLTQEYFDDKSFSGRKLVDDIILYGSPCITQHPSELSEDYTIADTAWVRATIRSMVGNANIPTNTDVPEGTISADMIAPASVTTDALADLSITPSKIQNGAITPGKLSNEAMITNVHLFDNIVTTTKIADNTITGTKLINGIVTSDKIANKAITSDKLEDEIELPANASVKNSDLQKMTIRNSVISVDLPTGGSTGEIWFQYE